MEERNCMQNHVFCVKLTGVHKAAPSRLLESKQPALNNLLKTPFFDVQSNFFHFSKDKFTL